MNPIKRRLAWLSPLLALSLVAAACGDDDDDDASATGSGTEVADGEMAAGSVIISGSSTVEPISIAVAESYEQVNPDVLVDVDGPGTGDGFALFCEGTTDISDASRAITDEEVETCEENGVEFIELYIAIDGLSVLTNPDNEVAECLSFADLYALMGPESDDVENWSDATEIAQELGSTTELPDASLDISAPGAESGTYDSFVELALEGIAEEREVDADPPIRNFPGQSDDNIIVQGIEGSDSSFGWVGFAFAEEAGEGVKEIAISEEPDGECVEPTAETISSGAYPLSRPLFIYVNSAKAEENPAVAAYVDYYLSDEGIGAVSEVGYVSIPDEDLAATRDAWESRTTGQQYGS